MSKKFIQSKSGQVSVSVLSKEAGSKSKKIALLSKKIMLTLALGACFFAVQNPVMAENINITSVDDLPSDEGSVENGVALKAHTFPFKIPEPEKSPMKDEEDVKLNVYYGNVDSSTTDYTVNINLSPSDSSSDLNFETSIFAGYFNPSKSVTNAEITLNSGRIAYIAGGLSGKGDAEYNTVKVIDCHYIAGDTNPNGEWSKVIGGYAGNGNARSNEVVIKGGITAWNYGGYAVNGNAEKNVVNVNIDSSKIFYKNSGGQSSSLRYIFGGYANNGAAKENIVELNTGWVRCNVYGGFTKGISSDTDHFDATRNTVTIGNKDVDNGSVKVSDANVNSVLPYIDRNVYGGYVMGVGSNAESNAVTMTNGKVEYSVFGGYVYKNAGNANSNEVTIGKLGADDANLNIKQNVYGGKADTYAGYVKGNSVKVNSGTINQGVYGGFADTNASTANEDGADVKAGDVYNNSVTINGGSVGVSDSDGGVYGGRSLSGDANKNSVTVTSGSVGGVYGGSADKGNAENNTVRIDGGTISRSVYGGNAGKGNAENNTVRIDGGTISRSVYGGQVNAEGSIAKKNTVVINSGTIEGDVYGGNASSMGGCAANENTVAINAGTVSRSVYGGFSIKEDAYKNTVTIQGGTVNGEQVIGGTSIYGTATANTVNINDGVVNANVIAGLAYYGGNVKDNIVNLNGGKVAGFVTGGVVNDPNSTISGNTLNVGGLDIEVGNVSNFDNINFFIPSSATNGSKMLTIKGSIMDAKNVDTDISKANVKAGVVAIEGDSKLKVGDTVTLIENKVGKLITDDAAGNATTYGKLTAQEGVSVKYDFDIEKKGENALIAKIKVSPVASDPDKTDESGLEPQTKSLVETQTAGMAMLNGGMDMLAGEGIANAIAAAADASGAAAGAGDGASAGAGSGSDGAASDGADYDGVSGKGAVGADAGREFAMFGMLGASNMKYKTGSHVDLDGWNIGLGFAKTVENNSGKLTFGPVVSYGKGSYDSYVDKGVHGEGDSDYLGISLFAHQANKDGLYYEGSIGAGRVSNDYSSNDLEIAGKKVHEQYDTDSTFVAAHLGIGKKLEVSDKAKLDVYGKYFYAHQGGDDAKLATGETYHFDAVDSNRIRVGARYEVENNAVTTTYVGTAYEYEFSGDAKATYKGMETPSPSLKGSSGMLELGWKVKPSAASPLTIDLSANGWCGQKEGYGLKANLLWNF